jgi:predicted DNA-binding transcriptional regulator YafY
MPKHHPQPDRERSPRLVRQWRLLVAIRNRPRTCESLAREFGVSWRTIYRDLLALESVPLPVTQMRADSGHVLWALASTPEWPRREPTPTRDLEARI